MQRFEDEYMEELGEEVNDVIEISVDTEPAFTIPHNTENEDDEDDEDDINIADVMDIRGEGGITVLQFGEGSEEGEAIETVIGGLGEEYGGCVDTGEYGSEDEDDFADSSSYLKHIMRRRKKKTCPFDEITGETSEAYLKAKPNTLKCRRITLERDRRFRALMENIPSLDQFVVESFVHTYHGYEIAKRWCMAHPDKVIEYMDDDGVIKRFYPHMREEELPHWRRYCAFSPTYLGQNDERKKATEPPRIEGAFTRREREERERKRPWYQNPNSLRPEDRICVLKTLDKMIIQPYTKMMNSVEDIAVPNI